MTQAIRYHRFSTRRQDRGSSIERQDDATRALCVSEGWNIVETIEDRGQSAWKGDHLSVGNLGKLRRRIDAGQIDGGTRIVVENLDRLSRQDYRTARRWIEDVTDRGIVIAVCRPALILDREAMSGSNIVAFLQHLLESNRATAEGDRKSEFQKKNIKRMTQMMRDGLCPSPRVPAWLNGVVGEPLTVIQDRAALVNLIYEWSASGLGLQSICKRLNADHEPWTDEGWKTGARQWRIGYVRDILNSPAVEGRHVVRAGDGRQPTGEIITGYYPRIVDADLVARARAAIKKRAGTGGAKRGEASNYFIGLMTCKQCGGSVGRILTGAGYAYMSCRNARYGTCENRSHMPYATLAKVVVDHLLHLALDDTHFAAVDDIAPIAARLADARGKIEALQTQQANMIQVLMRLPDSPAVIDQLERIEADLAAGKAKVVRLEEDLIKARGSVSPDEHLRRVKSVAASLDTDAEARRMVRDALPSLVRQMVWDGEKVTASGLHFYMTIAKNGAVDGFDLYHPKHGPAADPEYTRRRDAAIASGTYLPFGS